MRGRWAAAAVGAGVAKSRASAAAAGQAQAAQGQQQQAQAQIQAQQKQIEALQQHSQQSQQAQQSQQEDPMQKLQKYADLKQKGIITEEEYQKLKSDSTDERLIEMLSKGYTNKKIALHEKMPLSTIQRRIRRIYEKGYVIKKNEVDYRKLGFRKVYLFISLKGNFSYQVAQKISSLNGVLFISLVTGSIDILCICISRDTNDLFKIVQSIRAIERVDNVMWSEEVNSAFTHDMSILGFELSKDSLLNTGN
jgi:DNA-binding Lrp family transcriptional regulator